MNLFGWLIVGHLVGDFLLQTAWMAEHKAGRWGPLVLHSLTYTAAVTVFALFAGGLSMPAIALILGSHLLIDQRGLVRFWTRRVTRSEDSQWLKVMVDQTFHVLILAFATIR